MYMYVDQTHSWRPQPVTTMLFYCIAKYVIICYLGCVLLLLCVYLFVLCAIG